MTGSAERTSRRKSSSPRGVGGGESTIVPYDENLLERARTQWQFGDWDSLAKLDKEILQHHPDRAKLALLAAAGLLQVNKLSEARQYIILAKEWGVSRIWLGRILAASVYNSLGRASAIAGMQPRALLHFESAVTVGSPGSDAKLLTQARVGEQFFQLGLSSPLRFSNFGLSEASNGAGLQSFDSVVAGTVSSNSYQNFSVAEYWDGRYQKGGTSGYGSYGRLAQFKAGVINSYIKDEQIKSVIEFGCGDGNQLSLFCVDRYFGVDISSTIINKCRDRFKDSPEKIFLTSDEFALAPRKADLALSLDVVFHLVDDVVFVNYMTVLFDSAEKYCVIYSSNRDDLVDPAVHVRHRKFTDWVADNKKEWRLSKVVYNKFPHDGSINPKDLSFSDFYFFERI